MQENDSNAQNTTSTPIVEQAKDTAKQAVQQGQEVAEKAVDNARGQVKQQISTQKDKAASSLGQVANAIFLTSKHLRDQGQDTIGEYSDRLATGISDVSTYLDQHDLDEVVTEVTDFARRKPTLFVASAVVLGVLASRFLKSSSHREAQGNYATPNPIATYNEDFAASQVNLATPSTVGVASGFESRSASDTFDVDSDTRPDAINDLRDNTAAFGSSGNLGDTPMSGVTEIEDVTVIMSQDALDDDDELLTQSPIGTRSSNAV